MLTQVPLLTLLLQSLPVLGWFAGCGLVAVALVLALMAGAVWVGVLGMALVAE